MMTVIYQAVQNVVFAINTNMNNKYTVFHYSQQSGISVVYLFASVVHIIYIAPSKVPPEGMIGLCAPVMHKCNNHMHCNMHCTI